MLLGRPRTATPKLCETSIGEEGGVVYGGGVLDERTNRSKHSYGMSPGDDVAHHPLLLFCQCCAIIMHRLFFLVDDDDVYICCKIFLNNSAFYLVLFI